MIVMTKHSPAELRPYLEGSESLVALNGGYLYSSSVGIEWYLDRHPDNEAVLMTLRYEVKLNEY